MLCSKLDLGTAIDEHTRGELSNSIFFNNALRDLRPPANDQAFEDFCKYPLKNPDLKLLCSTKFRTGLSRKALSQCALWYLWRHPIEFTKFFQLDKAKH